MKPEEQGFVDPQDPRYVTYEGRRMLRVIGATGEVPEPAPEPTADPQPDPAPEPVPVPAPTGPWADQLAQFDEVLRPQVDGFLREHIQPYTTRLEQQLAERLDVAPEAAALYADLNDPDKAAATYLALTGELFEDSDLTDLIKDTIQQHYAQPDVEPDPAASEPPARDPEVQAMLDERNQANYDRNVAKAVEVNKIPEAWQHLIHPMIVSADGDIAVAGAALAKQLTDAGAITPEPAPDPAPPVPGAAPPAVPVVKDYKGDMGAAIDDFFDGLAASGAPPVGGV